jgi:hypothetical protein
MAIYYTDKSRSFGARIGSGVHRQDITVATRVAITTAMMDNVDDECGLFWLPAGAVVTGITVSATDMDTGSATLAYDIGDDGDEDRLMAASAVGQAGTLSNAMARTGHLYKYTSDTLIKAYVNAVSATGAAGTLNVSVTYFIDDNFEAAGITATTTA